jgi:hypothetical protein
MARTPYIKDINFFKAISYARSLMKKEKIPIQLAMFKAAKFYKRDLSDVAKYMGKLGASIKYGEEYD